MSFIRQIAVDEEILRLKDDPRDGLFKDNPKQWLWSVHQDYRSCQGCPRLVEAKRFTVNLNDVKTLVRANIQYQNYCSEQSDMHPEDAEKWRRKISEAKELEGIYDVLRNVVDEESPVATRRAGLKRLKDKLTPEQWMSGTVPQPLAD
jgi:hypothetical protein